jgi:hypothetical protein
VIVDGRQASDEWPGADVKPVVIERTPDRATIAYTVPHSYLRAAYDDANLYLLVTNRTRDAKTLTSGSSWGTDDGIEVSFCDAGSTGTTHVIRGFANGTAGVWRGGGATRDQVRALADGGLRYAVATGPSEWVAEIRVPLKAVGLVPAPGLKLRFNVAIRRAAENDILVWTPTGGESWQLDNAGDLVLQ